jgi:catechol 2,3-dioxygenase-like lactoylglutathione lyase family enzyme
VAEDVMAAFDVEIVCSKFWQGGSSEVGAAMVFLGGADRPPIGPLAALGRRKQMTVKNALAGIAVRNLDASIGWYEKLLDRSPDARPMDGLAEWQFSTGGWMQVFHDDERAGFSSVTLAEDDLDALLKQLRKKGIEIGPTTTSKLVKTAIIKDPDGNQIVFAQGMDFDHRSTA